MNRSDINAEQQWQMLVNAATLGTERAAASVDALAGAMPLAPHDDDDPATQLLAHAAAMSVYMAAGRMAVDLSALPAPPACDESRDRPCSAVAAHFLATILDGEYAMVLPEWLALAHEAGVVANPAVLPALLDELVRSAKPGRRKALLSVIGARGRWLACEEERWSTKLPRAELYGDAAGPDVSSDANADDHADDELWQTGTRDERLMVLERVRRIDAARAREMIAGVWHEETAADRTAMVKAFATGLSGDDEAFLETCLDDKSKLARAAAAELLSQIEGSAFVKRMAERAAACVRIGKSGRLIKKAAINVELPDLDDAMQRDGLEAKKKGSMGAKAALLCDIVAATPLAAWTTVDGKANAVDPSDRIALALASDWARPLCEGWAQAALRQQNATWARAVVADLCLFGAKKERGISDDFRTTYAEQLAPILQPADASTLAVRSIKQASGSTDEACRDTLIKACDFEWDAALTAAVLDMVVAGLMKKNAVYDNALRYAMRDLAARRLPPSRIDVLEKKLPKRQAHWSGNLEDAVDNMKATLRFRAAMRDAFAQHDASTNEQSPQSRKENARG